MKSIPEKDMFQFRHLCYVWTNVIFSTYYYNTTLYLIMLFIIKIRFGICQLSNCSAIPWRKQVNFQWDDDEVRFVLDQHAYLDFYSARLLKQQSVGRHVSPLGHIIPIPSQPVFALFLNTVCLAEKQQVPICFDTIGARTHGLPHRLTMMYRLTKNAQSEGYKEWQQNLWPINIC
jgi:hypothetical protein